MPATRSPDHAHRRSPENRRHLRRGVTLFELCMVLLIMAILAAVAMPSMSSLVTEQALRHDAREFALLVKTGMVLSGDERRAYALDLTSTSMALHPVDAAKPPAVEALGSNNKIEVPDPKRHNKWIDLPKTSWLFQPDELCPATTVRLARGDAWVEMSFNALTGNSDETGSYFP